MPRELGNRISACAPGRPGVDCGLPAMPRISFPTAIGPCGLAWTGSTLTAFHLPGDAPAARPADASPDEAPPWIRELVARVQRHLAGELQDFADVPLDLAGVPPFARRVYEATRKVPAGQTRTYGDLATNLGELPTTSRAIGAALGANPWSLIVPCHRIVGAGDRLTGFSAAGGVRTKARLLVIEGAQLLAE